MSDSKNKKVFGIDLGTTYSCISYVDEYGKPVIVPNDNNLLTTPSVVYFEGDNIIAGETAKEYAMMNPDQTVSFIKKFMGSEITLEINDEEMKPEEISALIIKKLIHDAQNNTGEEITDVVITCPAYFGINEKQATKNAGEIAGLNVRQILQEPVAAAITYGMKELNDKVVLVYDLGGGTFDVTLIELKEDSVSVICTGGDHDLGGKNWDEAIINYCAQQFSEEKGTEDDIRDNTETLQTLYLLSEKSKKTLTLMKSAPITFSHEGDRFSMKLTREKFYEITESLLERTIGLTNDLLEEAKEKGYEKIDEILLVGGSTRMPQIKERVDKEYDMDAKIFEPDEAVAKGAAIYGQKIFLEDLVLDIYNDEQTKKHGTSAKKENLDDLKQDEIKETLQRISESDDSNSDLINYTIGAKNIIGKKISVVASKSFGVIALNQNDEKIIVNLILKNDKALPVEVTQTFGTHVASQESILIKIVEDELNEKRIDDTSLGKEIGTATIDGLPEKLPAGSPIKITFKLNREGLLEIYALETTGNNEVTVTIKTNEVMNKEEIEKAKAKSEQFVVN